VPTHLRPTAPIAAAAVLVGDPGRALLLAQELLEAPKMSNHARGLWGYTGRTPSGEELTIQATGIGGPSAALVLADLAELGLRRAVRVGTCAGFADCKLGELLVVTKAIAEGGSSTSLGAKVGEAVAPDQGLSEKVLVAIAGQGRPVTVSSVDGHPGRQEPPPGIEATDMQTAPLLAGARSLGVAAAAVLIVAEMPILERSLEKDRLEPAEKRAGAATAAALSL